MSLPPENTIRYEVCWFRHAVIIDGEVDPAASRFERRHFDTLDAAREYIEQVIHTAIPPTMVIQRQERQSLWEWRDVGEQVIVEG